MVSRLRRGRAVRRGLPKFDPAPSARFAARALREVDVPGALIGRLAVWAYLPLEEEHEFTKDLDIALHREHMPLVRLWIERQGLSTRMLAIGGVNVYHPDSGVNVDFIDRTGRRFGDLGALFGEAVEAAVEVGETASVEGTELLLVPPEYLVVMKLVAGERSDEADLKRLVTHVDVDLDFVRGVVERHAPALLSRFEVLLREAGVS